MENITIERWRFINNGDGWWLRISSFDELLAYCMKTDNRFANAFGRLLKGSADELPETYDGSLSSAIAVLARVNRKSLVETTGNLLIGVHDTYFKYLERDGFLNINCVGGCNSCDWDIVANCYRKELVWPSFTKNDIRIKTFAPEEKSVGVYRDDYKYHYYAYLGDMQLTDGEKTKWDTYDEAYAFASNLVDSQ